MKKLAIVVALISILSLVLTACGGPGECPECPECEECAECPEAGVPLTDLGGREIRVAVDNAYPPFTYLDADGTPIGFEYDAWNEVCRRLNCTPVFVEAAWEGLFEAIQAGEYDATINGITLTLPRSLRIDYSDPYIEYGQVILVRVDDDRFPDEEALVASDATVATQLGTTNEIASIKMVGEERTVSFEEYDAPVMALLTGDVDTVIIDEVAAIGFMGANPGEMKVAFSVTGGELLAFVFPVLSPLTTPVTWAQHEMFADGTMDELCEKWLLRPCTPE